MLLGIFLLAPTDSITIYKNEMLAEAVIDRGSTRRRTPPSANPHSKSG